MENVFLDTRVLDSRAQNEYGLTEDIMMENAACALESSVLLQMESKKNTRLIKDSVLILAGPGNNGADGYALARRLCGKDLLVFVCAVAEPKSPLCKMQKKRAQKVGVSFITVEELADFLETNKLSLKVVVDCMFGSGFSGALSGASAAVVQTINCQTNFYKISCDLPSGLDVFGNVESVVFVADQTVTMGALKLSMFSEFAKDCCGKITVSNLGISRSAFESSDFVAKFLNKEDIVLPYRKKNNVNKGTFGHVAVVAGEKIGAAVMAASAAIRFGAGLVTVVSNEQNDSVRYDTIPYELMSSETFPQNTTAVALGMGLGKNSSNAQKYVDYLMQHKDIKCTLDADIFSYKSVVNLLQERGSGIVIAPHPKEFATLLEVCNMGKHSVEEILKNKVVLIQQFCKAFPEVVLILKGANVFIATKKIQEEKVRLYINTWGTNALAKAGCGDVLSGLVASLLAQGYIPLEAAISASLAHSLTSQKIEPSFALTPFDLINNLVG